MPSAVPMTCAALAVLLLLVTPGVRGHGSLYEPPSRGAMFHLGFNNPADNNFWESNCGGREEQWDRNGGRCGVCGDPYREQVPRDHENGGIYGNGLVGRYYSQGQTITATSFLSISHKGSISFSLCPLLDLKKPESEECFLRYPLRLATGETSQVLPKDFVSGSFNATLVLPSDVTCKQCVLRWKYRAGNDWGCDSSGECCVGCGKRQEEFYACSDIAIYPRGYDLPSVSQSTPRPSTQNTQHTQNPTPVPATFQPRPPYPSPTPQPTRYPAPLPTVYKQQPWAGDNSIVPVDSCPNMFCRVICRTPDYCPTICPAGCRKFYY